MKNKIHLKSNISLAAFDLITGEAWFNNSVNTPIALASSACLVSTNIQKWRVSSIMMIISSISCFSRSTRVSMSFNSTIAFAPKDSSETISTALCEFFLAMTSSSTNNSANTGIISSFIIAFRPLLLP